MMVTVSNDRLMIFGGFNAGFLSDGVLVDTEKKKVLLKINAGDFSFNCDFNRCCMTEYGAIIALIHSESSQKMIEVRTADQNIAVLEDDL